MTDIGGLIGAITGSGSFLVMMANWWATHRTTVIAGRVEERNETREPFIHESLNLRNAGDALGMMSVALETAEDINKRLRDDFRTLKADSDQTIASLKQELARLRDQVTRNNCSTPET